VLHRLLVPRHSPCALSNLTKKWLISVALLRPLVSSSPHALESALRDSSIHVLESLAAEPFLRETLKNDSLDFHL
ncbi:hypothetical protein P6709_20450, partial [Jeotgalibacillus sp. ET6]|uniref:hypothetical protein n=1 Tax=Jeotgalibacillus sp. ET6 TaxID=3037260 RepID=UPI0024183444